MHLATITACVIGVYIYLYTGIKTAGGFPPFFSYADLVKEIAIRAAWPPAFIPCTATVVSCWTPMACDISPPATRSRKSLLVRDPVTKVAYPIDAADYQKSSARVRVSQRLAVFALGYFTSAVVGSWLWSPLR